MIRPGQWERQVPICELLLLVGLCSYPVHSKLCLVSIAFHRREAYRCYLDPLTRAIRPMGSGQAIGHKRLEATCSQRAVGFGRSSAGA